MDDHTRIRVRVLEPQPWVDRTQPAVVRAVEDYDLDRPRADLTRHRRQVFAAVRDRAGGPEAVRSISIAAPGQAFDLLVYVRPAPPGQPQRRRPVVRAGPQGGPLGRTMRALKRGRR